MNPGTKLGAIAFFAEAFVGPSSKFLQLIGPLCRNACGDNGWVWIGVNRDAKGGLQKILTKFEGGKMGGKFSGSVEGHDKVAGLS